MLGAIIGDVVGSVFEDENVKTTDFALFSRFSRFTDDTVLTIAIAEALLDRKTHAIQFIQDRLNQQLYAHKLKAYGRRFPNAGYGEMFKAWLKSDSLHGYRSYGNGAAMRVSAIGFAFDTLEDVLREARLSAIVTHNHPDAIRGAQAVAGAIYLARTGKSKAEIKAFAERGTGYDLTKRLADIRLIYTFDSSCRGSVPQAIIAFLESTGFEDALRKAISLGGDSDTIACMTGGIAQAFYRDIPPSMVTEANIRLDHGLKAVIARFNDNFGAVRI